MERSSKIIIGVGIIFGIFLLIFYVLPYVIKIPEWLIIISAIALVWLFISSIVIEICRLVCKKHEFTKKYDLLVLAVLLLTIVPLFFEGGAPFNPFIKHENTWQYFTHPEKFADLGDVKYGELIVKENNP